MQLWNCSSCDVENHLSHYEVLVIYFTLFWLVLVKEMRD